MGGSCDGSAVRITFSAKLYLYFELSKRRGGLEIRGEIGAIRAIRRVTVVGRHETGNGCRAARSCVHCVKGYSIVILTGTDARPCVPTSRYT